MSSTATRRVHSMHVAGVSAGRLVVYASEHRKGTITIHMLDGNGKEGQAFYAELQPYTTSDGKKVKAAVFSPLWPANYKVKEPGSTYSSRNITVFPGEVAEVDFR